MSKVNVRKKLIRHTLAERAELKHIKQRSGPCKTRRRERRKEKREAYAARQAELSVYGVPPLATVYEALDIMKEVLDGQE